MLVQNTAPCPPDKVILLQLDHSWPMPKLQALAVDLQMETPTTTQVEEGPHQEMAISPIGQGHNQHFQVVILHHQVVAHQDLEDCPEGVDPQEVVVDHPDMEDPWVSPKAYCKDLLQHHREYTLM